MIMPENDPNAYLPPELRQSPIDPEPVQQEINPVSQQDAALAQAAQAGGGGNLFLDIAAGFATGFATGYTGRDLLTPFLAQQAERRKERTARVKLLNQVGTLINSYEKGGAIVDELLGITPETSENDRARAYAALDQNQLRLIENQINLDRAESDDEDTKREGLQSILNSVSAQAAAYGMEFIGDPTDRQQVELFANRVGFETEQRDRNQSITSNLRTESRNVIDSFGSNLGSMTDDEFMKSFLQPQQAAWANKDKLPEWELEVDYYLQRRANAKKDYERTTGQMYLESRALPVDESGTRKKWNDLTQLQRDQLRPQLTVEFGDIDAIIDLSDHMKELLSDREKEVLKDLNFGDSQSFKDWAENDGDVQGLLDAYPALQEAANKAKLVEANRQPLMSSLPPRLGLTEDDVAPGSFLSYQPGQIINLTPEGRDKARAKLLELLDPNLSVEQRKDIVSQGEQLGIGVADIFQGQQVLTDVRSGDLAEAPSVVSSETGSQMDRNFMRRDAPQTIKFDYDREGKMSPEETALLNRLEVTPVEQLTVDQKATLNNLDMRRKLDPQQDAADEANRNSMDILLFGENRNVLKIVQADIDPSTLEPKEVNVPALTAALSKAGEDVGEMWKELYIWTHDSNRREAQTATERKKSRGGVDSWARVEEIAGDDFFPDLEDIQGAMNDEWLDRMRPEYDKFVARMKRAREKTEWTLIDSFDKWLEDPPEAPPGNLEVINRMFGFGLNDSEITFEVGDKDMTIDIEDMDLEELALFAASVGLNA